MNAVSRPQTADEILGAARLMVRAKAPYFRSALLSLIPKEVQGMGTIGVTAGAQLLYDPAFISKQTAAQTAGLLVHELMHLMNRHPQRLGAREHGLWNAAGDLSINPSVRDMGFELPVGESAGLFPKSFNWPEGETADEYYRRLQERQEQQKQGGSDGKQGGSEGEDEKNPLGQKAGPGAGKCGSCAGNPSKGDQDTPESDAEDGRSEAQLDRMKRQVAEAIKEHVKQRGTVPAGLARWADAALEPPKVPWQQKLARTIRACCSYRPGAVVNRYDGPSRRQAGLGYGPGIPILPRLRAPIPNVAIVADTSGSMSEADLGATLRESRAILKAIGAEVTFLACDAEVHGGVQKVSSVEEMAKRLKGGGGSDFTPAFRDLMRARPRPEVVILATDGYIGAPKTCPPGMHVIWLVIGEGTKPVSWGEEVKIDS